MKILIYVTSIFFVDLFIFQRDLHSFSTRRSSDLNVSKLKVAWIFHTGDVSDGKHGKQRSGFEATQIGRAHGLNSSHLGISYAVFCLKKKKKEHKHTI